MRWSLSCRRAHTLHILYRCSLSDDWYTSWYFPYSRGQNCLDYYRHRLFCRNLYSSRHPSLDSNISTSSKFYLIQKLRTTYNYNLKMTCHRTRSISLIVFSWPPIPESLNNSLHIIQHSHQDTLLRSKALECSWYSA